ncbi:hypothetical protein T4B_5245 [Trichinella pseudospiralis]|uniref:Uncharacterized protein n=1 Tax=Trichinella pseudospiralis TaxID=6337 RepID=A0A0V1HBL2_TRIPS|nr:hypothetical protein T4B_5245 [Trichinella pseudospiralis]
MRCWKSSRLQVKAWAPISAWNNWKVDIDNKKFISEEKRPFTAAFNIVNRCSSTKPKVNLSDIFILCSIETAFARNRNQFRLGLLTMGEIASGSLPTEGSCLAREIDPHLSLEWSGFVGQVELSRPWSTIASGVRIIG